MGKLLGQAFLSHQVTMLERSIGNGNGRVAGQGRRAAPGGAYSRALLDSNANAQRPKGTLLDVAQEVVPKAKIAERIVVDASVLVHALDQVKKWSHESATRLIIPLEGKFCRFSPEDEQ